MDKRWECTVFRNVLLSVVVLASLVVAPAPAPAETAPAEFGAQTIDSDAVTDRIGLVDPATGIWFLRGQGGVTGSFFYGNPGDYPFVGDWNCDGIDTPGLYRQSDGFAYLRNSNTQGIADIRFFFGNPGDVPLAGDFDGDGCDTLSIYRPSEARIYVINQLGANDGGLGAAEYSYIFGNPGDKPFTGDFDGDGIDTLGLHRESTGFVYFRQTNTQGIADEEFFFGDPGDRLVSGDWGIVDGEDTPAIFRPSTATFYFRYTNTQGVADETIVWGSTTFLPIAGNWGTVIPGGPGNPGGPPPGLAVGGSLPNATVDIAYSAQISITGGTPPYAVQQTAPHPWASASPTGLITGTPGSGNLGLSNLQVRVTDSAGGEVFAAIPITVVNKCQIVTGTTESQCLALSQLYTSTNGNSWTERTNWFTPNVCEWHGIQCAVGNVSAINLDGNHLVGNLNAVPFGSLPGLQVFDINGNQVTGNLPISLTGLASLTTLDVGENLFFGDLSTSTIWSKANLSILDLSDNDFGGTIPDVTGWGAISTVDLSENAFSGVLPASMWNRTTLTSLDLAVNSFGGPLPGTFNMPLLLDLDLGENEFTGPIPSTINSLGTQLQHLDLHDNNLGGADTTVADALVPDSITSLTGLAAVQGTLELRGNLCLHSPTAGTVNFVATRDPLWNNGCPVGP